MRKKFLEKKLKKLQEKRASIKNMVDASTDVAEVRSLSSQLDDIDEEIAEIQEEIDIIDDEARSNAPAPANAKIASAPPARRVSGIFSMSTPHAPHSPSPAPHPPPLQEDSLPSEPPGKPLHHWRGI